MTNTFRFLSMVFICLNLFVVSSYAIEKKHLTTPHVLYPSVNPLSKKYLKKLHNEKQKMLYSGYSHNDIEKLFLAADNRDIAWNTANLILTGIETGTINQTNIKYYFTDEMKKQHYVTSRLTGKIIHHIRFLNNHSAVIHSKKTTAEDYLLLSKKIAKEKVNIVVFKHIQNEIVKLTLAANYPYTKWQLAGLHITIFYRTYIFR